MIIKIIMVFAFAIGTFKTYSQGCSDAGVCTVSSFKPGQIDSTSNQLKAGIYYGSADHNISASGFYIDYSRIINDKLSLNTKLTTLAQSGNNISFFGLSDLFVSGSYNIAKKTFLTLGLKIPLTNSNRIENNLPLPMDYQSSLGTLDLLFGIKYSVGGLHIVAALQQPLTRNSNTFIASDYPLTSQLYTFQSTNQFVRRGDALVRLSYPITLGKKFNFTPSLLPIYHLGNDEFTDESGITQTILGSQGLTLNWNAYFDYKLNSKSTLQLSFGSPLIIRKQRPDGLTRHSVYSLEYKISF